MGSVVLEWGFVVVDYIFVFCCYMGGAGEGRRGVGGRTGGGGGQWVRGGLRKKNHHNITLFHRGNRLETLWALLRMASTGCKPDLGKIPKNIDSQNIFVRIQRILRIS